jgi:hypothetical protein
MSNVPEHAVPLLDAMVNGAPVLMPASPEPVKVSVPFNNCPDTGMVVEQAAKIPTREAENINFFDFLNMFKYFLGSLCSSLNRLL